jgi:hypothetical protein
MLPTPSTIFAADALGTADFGDRRRAARARQLVASLAAAPGASISEAAGGDWSQTQASYRLLANKHLVVDDLIASIGDATGERIRASDVAQVLLIQDTTEIKPTSARGAEDLGPLANPGCQGLFLHSTLAVTTEGLPLGIAHQEVWVRDDEAPPSRPARYRTPIEGKESAKWLRSTQQALAHLAPHQQGIVVADREADIFELYHLCQTHGADLIVRAAQNRRIAEPAGKLARAATTGPVRGTAQVAVGRARDREPRTATVTIRATAVTLLPPALASYAAARRTWWAEHPDMARLVPADLAPLVVNVVEVTEDAPPDGVTPLHWRLLTTVPVATLHACTLVIDGYALRWLDERFHYVLKSGCRLEHRQLESADGWQRATILSSVVAWQVLWLTELGRTQPGVSAASVVPTPVWQVVGTLATGTIPTAPPTLAHLVAQIGRLGGHLGRTGDGPPGVKTLWRGLRRVHDVLGVWHLIQPATEHPQSV